MRRWLGVIALGLPLGIAVAYIAISAGRQAATERTAQFMAECAEAGFGPNQCAFLFAVSERVESKHDYDAIMQAALAAAH